MELELYCYGLFQDGVELRILLSNIGGIKSTKMFSVMFTLSFCNREIKKRISKSSGLILLKCLRCDHNSLNVTKTGRLLLPRVL